MLSLILSWRYFTRKKVAIAAIVAIALIVMMVTIVLNIMSGIVNEVRGKNHNWSGDIVISRNSLVGFDYYQDFIEILNNCPIVQNSTPVIRAFGITSDNQPVIAFGVEQNSFNQTCSPGKLSDSETITLSSGSYYSGNYFGNQTINGSSYNLNITFPGINYRGLLAGSETGQNQNFKYAGTFRTGIPDIDNAIILDFSQLQKLCWMAGQDNRPARTHQIRIKLKDDYNLQAGINQITSLWNTFLDEKAKNGQDSLLKDVSVQTWYQSRRAMIAPLENEKNMMSLVFAIIAIVCSFIIFAIFHMIVIDKQKDIGIIKSCGASRWQMAQTFLNFGVLIGFIGTSIGLAIAVVFITHTNQIQEWLYAKTGFMLWPPDLYAIDKIPDIVIPSETATICMAAIIFSILGAIIPAYIAANKKPVDSLRVE